MLYNYRIYINYIENDKYIDRFIYIVYTVTMTVKKDSHHFL